MSHCTCMADMSETCNHVAALLFRMNVLMNEYNKPSCTDRSCTWNKLPNRSEVVRRKIKDIEFSRDNFDKKKKKKKKLISTPKKTYNPLEYCNIKSLTLQDIVKA